MSLLRSYSFCEEIPDEIWELFKDAKDLGTKWDYTLEILNAAQEGRIDFQKEFNLGGYIQKIESIQRMKSGKRAKRWKSICSDFDEWNEDSHFVSEDIVSQYAEQVDTYKEVENEDELKYAVDEINKLSRKILIEHRLDIYKCMEQGARGIPETIELLKDLVSKDAHVGEILKIILSSGYKLKELFPDEVK